MADEREREGSEDAPRIRVVDRRMLSDDERAGKGAIPPAPSGIVSGSGASADTANGGAADSSGTPPKLEIVGGGRQRAQQPEPNEVPDAPPDADFPADDMDEPLLEPQQPAPMGEPDDDTPPPMQMVGGAGEAQGMMAGMDGADEEMLSDEEMEQVRAEMEAAEAEQFAVLEQRMGRPLTEQEKVAVRQEMERQAQSMTSLEVAPMLQQMMAEVSARAAVHMGLMPNPYTRLIARNDTQARLAVDAFGAVFEVLKPHLDASMQREYARVLNDLRVNFVSLTGASAGGGPSRIIH